MRDRPFVRAARGALSGMFFFLYGLLALPFAPFLPLMTKRRGRRTIRAFYKGFVLLARLTGLFAVDVSRTAPRASGARIVVMNHVSLIDICVLLANLGDAVCIAKPATARNPFLGAVVRKLFISGGSGAEGLEEARKYLEDGIDVVIFPQGTRGGKDFRRGAARLALRSSAPVEAWRIDYDPVVLAKGQPWWDVGAKTIRIRLVQTETITPEESDSRPSAVRLTERIKKAVLTVWEKDDKITAR